MQHQDWSSVRFPAASLKKEKEKRNHRQPHEEDIRLSKLASETDELKHERVSKSIGLAVSRGRVERGMSQKELAGKLCVPVQTIQSLESGKHILDKRLLSRIEREVGVSVKDA